MNEDNLLLFKRMGNNDPDAYTEIRNKYYKSLRFTIMKWLDSDWMIEEVVYDTLLELWEKRDKVMQMQSPEGWLHTVARNKAVSADRKECIVQKIKEKYMNADFEADAEMDAIACAMERILHEGVAKLPPRQQEVARMILDANPSRKKIAQTMKISERTVENHIARLTIFLRKYIRKNFF